MAIKVEPISESYFYILLCLSKEPMHGYGIMQFTEQLSEGQVRIGSGTMYGATSNMIKKGWIKEVMENAPGLNRRRMYMLTEEGRDILDNEICRLQRMLKGVELI